MTARPVAELWKSVAVERRIDLPAAHLYRIIGDFNEHHPKFLPEAFHDLRARTTFRVTPDREGAVVRIDNEFRMSPGFRGVIEGLIAPPVLRRLLAEELARLEAYARKVPV